MGSCWRQTAGAPSVTHAGVTAQNDTQQKAHVLSATSRS